MKRIVRLVVAVCCLSIIAFAQYGTAPNNYYPDSYTGSIFKGVVTETKNDELVLTFTKGNNTKTFTGRFETACSIPLSQQGGPPMGPADIPKGTVVTAFFNAITKKDNGKKIKENVIIAIAFDVWQGQKIPEDKMRIYWCTNILHRQFRVY